MMVMVNMEEGYWFSPSISCRSLWIHTRKFMHHVCKLWKFHGPVDWFTVTCHHTMFGSNQSIQPSFVQDEDG